MRAYLQQSFISTCFILCSIISQIAYASPAIDWILSTQNANGSYVTSTDKATATQSTSEALSVFPVPGMPDISVLIASGSEEGDS